VEGTRKPMTWPRSLASWAIASTTVIAMRGNLGRLNRWMPRYSMTRSTSMRSPGSTGSAVMRSRSRRVNYGSSQLTNGPA
jgi:hypothetical protein